MAALIMLQSLFFKFSAAPESVYIFSVLGMEPWGRIGIGTLELIASVLILLPSAMATGAALAMGLMSGAIYFHLMRLGIVVQNDSGQLFAYACIVLLCSLALLYLHRAQFFLIITKLKKKLF